MRRFLFLVVAFTLLDGFTAAAKEPANSSSWRHFPGQRSGEFPIAVWLQSPRRAKEYRAAGINLYIGLWKGPTEEQLDALAQAGMPVVCHQNEVGLKHIDDPNIVGWMHGDEPDNAQSRGKGQGYGPPIPPETVRKQYDTLRRQDPSRPVLLNLGQGVAWDGWRGRGVRSNHPEDYPQYARGADYVSFDIYPAAHKSPDVAGKLWYVAQGVERLKTWAGANKPVWCCIECTHINNPQRKATPHEVEAEVWMAIIHGAEGLIYFSHQFKPRFIEAGMLADAEMTSAVTRINQQIQKLAGPLRTPTINEAISVQVAAGKIPVATMVKRHDGAMYLFAVNMRGTPAEAMFTLKAPLEGRNIECLGETRALPLDGRAFRDQFGPWDVRLYRITE
ncbi:MAG: beta-galactosidase [Pirellulaceae bacterium]|nr:beta-galactosidase [Pirellulaceae bacterium]